MKHCHDYEKKKKQYIVLETSVWLCWTRDGCSLKSSECELQELNLWSAVQRDYLSRIEDLLKPILFFILHKPSFAHRCVFQVLTSVCFPTTAGLLGAGEGAVQLQSRGRRRAGVFRRWPHRGVRSLRPRVVDGEAAGEERVVSCKLHRTVMMKHLTQPAGEGALFRGFWKPKASDAHRRGPWHSVYRSSVACSGFIEHFLEQQHLQEPPEVLQMVQLSQIVRSRVWQQW